MKTARARGFTLIEVLVALIIVAFGMGALLATLASAADTAGHLRDKSLAQWIAMNRVSEVRLRGARPGVGKTTGDVEYAGQKWRWYQEVLDPKVAGILRIDVGVVRVSDVTAQNPTPPALALASGFIGTALTPGSGLLPDWSTDTMVSLQSGTGGTANPPATPVPTPNATPPLPGAGE